MLSSRMRTASSLPTFFSLDRDPPGQRPPPRTETPWTETPNGQRPPWKETETSPMDKQTPVKTLPSQTSLAGGKYDMT